MPKAKYEEWLERENLLRISAWARDGLTNEQVAANMGITRQTLRVWMSTYPSISAALKSGKEVADIQVENALFKAALGYEYEEVTQEPLYNNDGHPIRDETGEPVIATTKIVRKQVQPNTTAQIFWLKNRRPEQWRDKRELDAKVSGSLNHNGADLSGLTTEELRRIAETD